MINFFFCKNDGYFPNDTEILQLMLLKPPNKIKKSVNKLQQKKLQLWVIFLLKPEGQLQFRIIVLQ